jgi:hypothetical protein
MLCHQRPQISRLTPDAKAEITTLTPAKGVASYLWRNGIKLRQFVANCGNLITNNQCEEIGKKGDRSTTFRVQKN